MRRGLVVLAAGLLLLALAALGGAMHPAGDSVAAFALHLAAVAIAVYACSWLTGQVAAERLSGLAFVLLAVQPVWLGMQGRDAGAETITVYQHNVLYLNPTPQEVVAQIAAADADIVLLQEVYAGTAPVGAALAEMYPYASECPGYWEDNTRIHTRFEMDDVACRRSFAAATLATPLGPVRVFSVHLEWPWPYEQEATADAVVAALDQTDLPVLLAGDMNGVAWSHAVRRIAERGRLRQPGGVRLTFADPRFWPGLPIDHILIPRDWGGSVTMLDAAGSDHRASLAVIGPRD